MESVLRRYIIEYVTCKTCKSMNTELKRESANRLHFLSCKACGSTRSVSSIKTGFQAQIGRERSSNRDVQYSFWVSFFCIVYYHLCIVGK